MAEKKGKSGARVAWTALGHLLKGVLWAVVIAVPLLGVWAASSLAVYWDGPLWAAYLAGLAAFPLLPLLWEGIAAWRRGRRDEPRERILTLGDRVIARTFVISLLFLGAFLLVWPVPIFEALAARGDWMLEGREDPTSETLRGALHATADHMAWLYELAREDDFESEEGETPTPTPTPRPEEPPPRPTPEPEAPDPQLPAEPHARIAATRGDAPPRWPLPNAPHPAIAELTDADESSIESLARAIAEREADPYLRVKAMHDWVAEHIAYDAPAYEAGDYPPQDAPAVFERRVGVCAGYANLMVAMGEAMGEHVVYVGGHVRDEDDGVSGEGHAWNAVEIEGRWYLLDATWDAGSVDGPRFEKAYKSDYFMTPPDLFVSDHFPDDEAWQLREDPMSRGEFVRQPRLRPTFYRAGFTLVSPRRSHVTVRRTFEASVRSERGHFLMASYRPHGAHGDGERCEVTGSREMRVSCRIAREGTYDVVLFESPLQYGTYWSVGSFTVVRR